MKKKEKSQIIKNKAAKNEPDKKKKARRAALIVTAVLLIALALPFAANLVITGVYGVMIDTAPEGEKFDCILILGAKVFENGSVSAMLADRLDRGIELYFSGASDKILVSGDHGEKEYDEVNAMKEYCVQRGVPAEDVFMDHAGFSTYESVVRAQKVFKCESVLIVSQKYHLYRALYIADAKGLDAYGASAAPTVYPGYKYREAREFLARCKDVFYVVFNVPPRYLGEEIPITDNGNLTNDR